MLSRLSAREIDVSCEDAFESDEFKLSGTQSANWFLRI
jgi:hypothetical protein